MSGIAGYVGWKKDAFSYASAFENLMETMKQRSKETIQQMITHTIAFHGEAMGIFKMGEKEWSIILDGELYDEEELRRQLAIAGYPVKSASDQELILFAFLEWGEKCLTKLNGVFSLAIWNNEKKELFVARDALGVRPFFYACIEGQIIFGSEIKYVLAHPLVSPTIDQLGVAEVMLIGPGRTLGTGVFRHVKELKPGHYGYLNENKEEFTPFFALEAKPHTDSFEETQEKVRKLLTTSIWQQSKSTSEIGSFLSGGLDSSIVATLSGVTKTFSVDYEDNNKYFQATKFQPDSDDQYIETMKSFLGTKHTKIVLSTDDLVDSIFEAVLARDLPGMADVDGSLLLFCRKVKEHVPIALSGECADEIFGGYPWFRDKDIRETNGFPWSQSTMFRASFLKEEWTIEPKAFVQEKYQQTLSDTKGLSTDSLLEARMREMFMLNQNWFMQTLLDRGDRMSQWSGLSVRIPFCDPRLISYLYNVPWEMKDHLGREKGLLRLAMANLLPNDVLWRKKSPYPKTHNPYYLEKVTALLEEVVASNDAPILQICKKDALVHLIEASRQGSGNLQNWYGQLMSTPQTIAYMLQVNFWLDAYHINICSS